MTTSTTSTQQWEDTTKKHWGSNANGRQAAKLTVGERTASVRTDSSGGFRLVCADGHHGKASDMYTIEVKIDGIYPTWEEAIAVGEEWCCSQAAS